MRRNFRGIIIGMEYHRIDRSKTWSFAATISKYGNIKEDGSSILLCLDLRASFHQRPSSLRNSLHPCNSDRFVLPLNRPILRPIEASPASPLPCPRSDEKHETLPTTLTSWDRSRALLKVWEHRCSAFHNHCSPILIHVFVCKEGAIRGERLCVRFKGFSCRRSLVVAGYLVDRTGNDRSCARSRVPSSFLWRGFLPRFSFFFIPPNFDTFPFHPGECSRCDNQVPSFVSEFEKGVMEFYSRGYWQ